MTLFLTSALVVLAAFIILYIPKLYERKHSINVFGHVEPGYEDVLNTFRNNFETGAEPEGATFSAYVDGACVVDLWGGYADSARRLLWQRDTLTNALSVTKGMAAVVIGHMVRSGRLQIDTPVAMFWPEFGQNGKENITVAQLLSHRAGLPYLDHAITIDLIKNPEALGKYLAAQAPAWPPGLYRGYHVFTIGFYLDQVVRHADPQKRSIAAYFEEEIAKPYDIDFYMGLPRDLNSRVATLKNEPYFRSLTGFYQKLRFGLMIYSNSMTKKTLLNPDFIVKSQSLALNKPEVRALNFPSVVGLGTARSIAKVYGILANGGTYEGKTLMDPKTIERFRNETSPTCEKDVIMGTLYKFALGTGFVLIPNPFGKVNFGFPGHGLQLAFADPEENLGYAYLTNTIANDQLNDMRGHNLVKALYKSINSAATRKARGRQTLEDKLHEGKEAVFDSIKSAIEGQTKPPDQIDFAKVLEEKRDENKGVLENVVDTIGMFSNDGESIKVVPDLKERQMHENLKSQRDGLFGKVKRFVLPYIPLASLMGYRAYERDSKQDSDYYGQVKNLITSAAQKIDLVKGKSDQNGVLLSSLRDAISRLNPHLTEFSKDHKRINDLGEKVTDQYYQGKKYLDSTLALIQEASKRLLHGNPEEHNFIVDQVAQYLLGMKHYLTDEHPKSYFERSGDLLSTYKNSLSKLHHPAHKGYLQSAIDLLPVSFFQNQMSYLEGAKDLIYSTAHKLSGAKSHNDIQSILDGTRKSFINMNDQLADFVHVKKRKNSLGETISDKYYESKAYIDSTNDMIQEAVKRLSDASAHDAHAIVDLVGQYLVGMRDYATGHKQKSYFQSSLDSLAHMKDNIVDSVHPHKKGYLESAYDSLGNLKDSIVDTVYPHKPGYIESAKNILLETAHKLSGAKSHNDIQSILDGTRKSLINMNDQLADFVHVKKRKNSLGETISDKYYESKAYVDSTNDMIQEAVKRLSDASTHDAHAIVDLVGQYLVGMRDYATGHKQKSYFQSSLDSLAHMKDNLVDSVHPHKKGYLESAYDSLGNLKDSIVDTVYPHKPGYIESAKNTLLETAHKLSGAKSHNDIQSILDGTRKSLINMNDQLADFVHVKKRKNSLGETISDKYYESKAYVDSTNDMIQEAVKRLSDASTHDAHAIVDLVGQYLVGMRDYATGHKQKSYFQSSLDSLAHMKDNLVDSVHPHKKGYLENAYDSLGNLKDSIVDTVYPHKPGYIESAKNTLLETAHKLSRAKSHNDIQSILDGTRKSLINMNDQLADFVHVKKRKNSLGETISDKYYESKAYVDSTNDMIQEAVKRLSDASTHDAHAIVDLVGQYLVGMRDYATGHKQKSYFQSSLDSLAHMKDNLVDSVHPHKKGYLESAYDSLGNLKDSIVDTVYPHKPGYIESAKNTLLETAHKLSGAKSHNDIQSILDGTRKSLINMNDQLADFVHVKKPKNSLGETISDKYYESKAYIDSTNDMIQEAVKRLSDASTHDAHAIVDLVGQYLVGMRDYATGHKQKSYFQSSLDSLAHMKDNLVDSVHPHKKGYLESAYDSLGNLKDSIVDTVYPHKPGYIESAKNTLLETAHKLSGAKSHNDIQSILDDTRKSLINMNDQLADFVHVKKRKNSLGETISDKYYESKAYVDSTNDMIQEAVKRLSDASTHDAHAIVDLVGQYLVGMRDYATGHKQKSYFQSSLDSLAHMKDNLVDSVHPHRKGYLESAYDSLGNLKDSIVDTVYPHKPGYIESAKNTLLETAHKLSGAKSHNDIQSILDGTRKSLINMNDQLADFVHVKKGKNSLGETISDKYYESKAYIDSTNDMIQEAVKRLSDASTHDAHAIVDLVGQYLVGMRDYATGHKQKSYFQSSLDSLAHMKDNLVDSVHPHIKGYLESAYDSLGNLKDSIVDTVYPHKPGYIESAKNTLLETAHKLSGAKSHNDIQSILDGTRKSLINMNHQLADFVHVKKRKNSLGETISDKYYESKAYVDSTNDMIQEAVKRLSDATTHDAHAIVDLVGQYLVGMRDYATGHKQKSYFQSSLDSLAHMKDNLVDSVHPHKKGYLESAYDSLGNLKDSIVDTVYPHKPGYIESAKNTLLETAHKLSGAKSHKDIQSILDGTRKSLINMNDQLADFVHVKKRKNSLGETISDKYYESKAYVDSTNDMIQEAVKRLSDASTHDAHAIVDLVGQYLVGMRDYATGHKQKSYFQSSLDSLAHMKDNLVDSVHPHRKGYLESAYDSLGNLKDSIVDTVYPHKPGYIESAKNTLLETAHKLSGAKSHNDIQSILDGTRKSLINMNDQLADFVHVKKRKNSLGETIFDKYYESKAYIDSTNDMIQEAVKRLSDASTHDAHAIVDLVGQYLVGMRDYATGHKQKSYFQSSLDSLAHMKDNLVDSVHPHKKGYLESAYDSLGNLKDSIVDTVYPHKPGYIESAKNTLLETAHKLSGAKSHNDIQSILDGTRKSLINMNDQLADFVHVKKRKNSLGETISDKYYESKAYIDSTNDMIQEAVKRLSDASTHDAHAIVDLVGQYLVGMRDYATGHKQKSYFQSSLDSLAHMKDNLVDSVHPHKKGYLESAYDSLGNLKNRIVDTVYPHKPGYIESAKNTLLETAHKLSGAKSHNDIQSILDGTRKSLINMNDQLADFVHVKKRKNSLGETISDKYYESKAYVDSTNDMIQEAVKRLSDASTHDARAIVDLVGQYLVGMRDYATGHKQKSYFQSSLDSLAHMKDNLVDSVHPHKKGYLESAYDSLGNLKDSIVDTVYPHKPGYIESAKNTLLETAHKLSGAKSHNDIQSILDGTRKSLINMNDQLADFVHVKKRKNSLGETISDKYYESKAYVDSTNDMIQEAVKRLSDASTHDAHAIVDLVGQYLVGMRDYATGHKQKSYFQSSLDSLAHMKDNLVDSVHPHKKGYLESAYDSLGNLKDSIVDTVYPHKPGYIESAKNTLLETAQKLSGAKSHNDIQSILDGTRKSLINMNDQLADFVHVKKRKNSLGETISDKYYETKAYIDSTNDMIQEAVKRLSDASTHDAHAIVDLVGQYLVGMRDYATGHKQKSYFQSSLDSLAHMKDNLVDSVHPHKKGYLESAYDSLGNLKDSIVDTVYPHKPGYIESAKNTLLETAHKLSGAKSHNDIQSILDGTRKSLINMNDQLADFVHVKKRKNSLGETISDKYYESKAYVDSTNDMIQEAVKRLSDASTHDAHAIVDLVGQYLVGMRDYATGHKQKSYFQSSLDSLAHMKDNLVDSVHPHKKGYLESAYDSLGNLKDSIVDTVYPHKPGYIESAKNTLLETAHKLSGAKSHNDIQSILDGTRKSLINMNDQLADFVHVKKRKNSLGETISDKYYESKAYIDSTNDMIQEAVKRLSDASTHDAHAIVDLVGQYLVGMRDYATGHKQKSYFQSSLDSLAHMKDNLVDSVHPHKKGYLESAYDSLGNLKDRIVDTVYPHKPGYIESAKNTLLETAHKLSGAKSHNDIQSILDGTRKSLINMNDQLADFVHVKKRKNSLGETISDKYYESKAYVDSTNDMIQEAVKRLSDASTHDARAIVDLVGQYLVGMRDYATGHKQKSYFQSSLDSLAHMKDNLVDSVHPHKKRYLESAYDSLGNLKDSIVDTVYPHKPGYIESAKNTLLETAHKLSGAKSHNDIQSILDGTRKSLINMNDQLADFVHVKKRKNSLGETISDKYYESKAYIDSTNGMIQEAVKRLSDASTHDAHAIVDLVGQYLVGMRDYATGHKQKSYFQSSLDSLAHMKDNIVDSVHPHQKGYLERAYDSLGNLKDSIVDTLYPHKPGYIESAKNTLLETAHKLSGAKSHNDIQSILDGTRKSLINMNDQLADFVHVKKRKNSLGETISDKYYESKAYVDSTNNMIQEAVKRLSDASTHDAHAIVDLVGQYLVGMRDYATGHKQKSYFQSSLDSLAHMKDNLVDSVHPHKKSYLESAYDSLGNLKDSIVDTVYPHKPGYIESAKNTLLETAHKLSGAKSHNDIQSILDGTRKSLINMNDQLADFVHVKKRKNSLGETISDKYYESKAYIDSTNDMIQEAVKRLSDASTHDAHAIVDLVGQYLVGMRDYATGHKQKSYFQSSLDSLAHMRDNIVDSVHPHKKGYLESTYDTFEHVKESIVGKLYPHHKGIYEKTIDSLYNYKLFLFSRYLSKNNEGYASKILNVLSDVKDSILDTICPPRKGQSTRIIFNDIKDKILDSIYYYSGYKRSTSLYSRVSDKLRNYPKLLFSKPQENSFLDHIAIKLKKYKKYWIK